MGEGWYKNLKFLKFFTIFKTFHMNYFHYIIPIRDFCFIHCQICSIWPRQSRHKIWVKRTHEFAPDQNPVRNTVQGRYLWHLFHTWEKPKSKKFRILAHSPIAKWEKRIQTHSSLPITSSKFFLGLKFFIF